MNKKVKEAEPKKPTVFLALPFPPDKEHGEELIRVLEKAGFQVRCFVKDVEDWGRKKSQNPAIEALKMLEKCQFLIIDASEIPEDPGFDMGIEAGWAKAKKIPIIVLCPEEKRKELKPTVKGIADKIIYYKNLADFQNQIATLPYVST